MIQVKIKRKDNKIINIRVSGHAKSDEYGKDLVCAGVSTACVGIANALVNYDFLQYGSITLNEGLCEIEVDRNSETFQIVLEVFVTILETIEESYHEYINIMKMEV